MSLYSSWGFNENDTTKVWDRSGNARHSTSVTGLTIVTSDLGKAGRFDGSTTWLQFGNIADFGGTANINILIKFKIAVLTTTHYFLFKNNHIKIYINNVTRLITWEIYKGGGWTSQSTAATFLTATWYKLGLSYDGVNMKMYINAVIDATLPTTGNLTASSSNLNIGSYNDGASNFLNGDIETFEIRNAALTADNITALSNFPNGMKIQTTKAHSFAAGDLLIQDYGGQNIQAIVTLNEDSKTFHVVPVSAKPLFNYTFIRVGNIKDTARQYFFEQNIAAASPTITIRDGISTFALLTDASTKKVEINKTSITTPLIFSPKIIGGTSTTQTLTYQTTSGVGTTGADHIFLVGNNGATEAMRIFNSGDIGIGTTNDRGRINLIANATLRDGGWNAGIEMDATVGNPYPAIIFGNQSGVARAATFVWTRTTSGNDGRQRQCQFQAYETGNVGIFEINLNTNIGTNPGLTSVFYCVGERVSVCASFTTPTAKLHIGAGSATANTAPLQFTSGVSETVARAGCVEFTTNDLFFTITTGAARKRFLFADDVGGLTSGRIPIVTTNGRLTDDADFTFAADTLTVTKIAAHEVIGNLTLSDGINIITNATTGTKIGTATTEKIGLWNAIPVVQYSTTGTVIGFSAVGGSAVFHTSTFTGNTGATAYTIGDIVKALKTCGIMAS